MNKFDPSKGSKAFTYFSVVSKNWFIAQVKKTSKKAKREIHLEDYYISTTSNDNKSGDLNSNLVVHNPYLEMREKHEFLSHLKGEVIYAIRYEFARKLDDFMRRRTWLSLKEHNGLQCLDEVADLFSKELSWNEQEKQKEKQAYYLELGLL